MGVQQLSHQSTKFGLPPLELLEPNIDRTPTHWYWLGDFTNNLFVKLPIIRWSPSHVDPIVFSVGRLLWCWTYPDRVRPRLSLVNTCDVPACINPAHWRKQGLEASLPLFLAETDDARAVQIKHALDKTHIAHNDSSFTLCGKTHARHLDVSTAITCQECVKTWRARH